MADLLLLDVVNGEVKDITINDFEDYHKYLGCRCFDIPRRRVGRQLRRFDMFVDDEGLLKEAPIVSAIDNLGSVMLVGNIIFANHDDEGNTTSLSNADKKYIKKYIQPMYTRNKVTGEIKEVLMLTQCEY